MMTARTSTISDRIGASYQQNFQNAAVITFPTDKSLFVALLLDVITITGGLICVVEHTQMLIGSLCKGWSRRQCFDDAAFFNRAVTALLDKVLKFAAKRYEIGDLALYFE